MINIFDFSELANKQTNELRIKKIYIVLIYHAMSWFLQN